MDSLTVISGTKEDNILTGTGGTDILLAGNGDDVLDGGAGDDSLSGGNGDDTLDGGAGDDSLSGGNGDDTLDGGAGSDDLLAGRGDDTLNYTLSENTDETDYYDGGKGFDTLQLTLTSAEQELVQADIDAFYAFLETSGSYFQFQSFDLLVRGIEALEIVTVGGENTAPVADDDSFTFDEDTPTVLDVLDGDTDADGDSLSIVNFSAPANGSLSLVDGILTYTPNADFNGTDSFTYQASDGTDTSNVATVSLTINPVNDRPVAGDDPNVTALAELAAPAKIRVAVLGRADDPTTVGINEGTTHVEAIAQLANAGIFEVDPIIYTTDTAWAGVFNGYDVVVVGDSGYSDYANETATGLFAELSGFVAAGGGVVTTGWFAQALPNIKDQIARGLADGITPIASALNHDYAGINGPDPDVISVLANHEIVDGPSTFQLSTKFGWELAGKLDDPLTGATLLATGVASNPDRGQIGTELPAIAYDDAVGMGRTAYLGGLYLSSTDFNPTQAHTDPVLDEIFERAVAWAAGARAPTASVTIDDALLLANDSDVETALAGLSIDSVALQNENGAAISLDANGDVVYTPSAAGLQQLLAGRDIADSFDYRVIDGNGGFDTASVSFTVTGFTTDTII